MLTSDFQRWSMKKKKTNPAQAHQKGNTKIAFFSIEYQNDAFKNKQNREHPTRYFLYDPSWTSAERFFLIFISKRKISKDKGWKSRNTANHLENSNEENKLIFKKVSSLHLKKTGWRDSHHKRKLQKELQSVKNNKYLFDTKLSSSKQEVISVILYPLKPLKSN